MFGVSCLAFGMKFRTIDRYVRKPNTKHARKKFVFLTFYEIIKASVVAGQYKESGRRCQVKIRVQLPAHRDYSPEGGPGFGPHRLPARRAYSSEREVIWLITFTSSVQVSGLSRCQVSGFRLNVRVSEKAPL